MAIKTKGVNHPAIIGKDRDARFREVGAKDLHPGHAIHTGQAPIEQNEIEIVPLGRLQGVRKIGASADRDLRAEAAQDHFQALPDEAVILGDQNPHATPSKAPPPGRSSGPPTTGSLDHSI